MFTRLDVKNFKGWKDTPGIRLAPVTVFFGTNSAGKTSLLQSLLLLKQSAESADRNRVLCTGQADDARALVNLGTVAEMVHGHGGDTTMEFDLAWTMSKELDFGGRRSRELAFLLRVSQGAHGGARVEEMRYVSGDARVGMRRGEGDSYELESSGITLRRRKARFGLLPAPVRYYGFPPEVGQTYLNSDWLADLSFALEQQFLRLHYVGPLREYPLRSYLWSGASPRDVGVRGEDAVPVILAARFAQTELRRERPGKRGACMSFEAVIAEWLKQMGVIDSFRVEQTAAGRKEYEVRVRRTARSPEVLITDVGFGVSQILPVLVQSFYAEANSTVIFEQPEIHLHPRVQADLADVVIDAVRTRDVQFIIESHSEHFLRRLQRRVAEGEEFTKDDVALYVCDTEGDHSRIGELVVDDVGNITNWPKDFFGDEIADLAAMTDAALKRRKGR